MTKPMPSASAFTSWRSRRGRWRDRDCRTRQKFFEHVVAAATLGLRQLAARALSEVVEIGQRAKQLILSLALLGLGPARADLARPRSGRRLGGRIGGRLFLVIGRGVVASFSSGTAPRV